MAEPKLRPNDQSVTAVLDKISDEARRKECYTLVAMMKRVTGTGPRIWATGLVGFGSYPATCNSWSPNERRLLTSRPLAQLGAELLGELLDGIRPLVKRGWRVLEQRDFPRPSLPHRDHRLHRV